MSICINCSIEFPDDTYTPYDGYCGAEPCRRAYFQEIAEELIPILEKMNINLVGQSEFETYTYYPKLSRDEQINLITLILLAKEQWNTELYIKKLNEKEQSHD